MSISENDMERGGAAFKEAMAKASDIFIKNTLAYFMIAYGENDGGVYVSHNELTDFIPSLLAAAMVREDTIRDIILQAAVKYAERSGRALSVVMPVNPNDN